MMESRSDSRTSNQLRPFACSRKLLNRAHGSARWSQDNTIVLVAVYGPSSVSGKRENPERATLEVIWKSKTGVAGNAEREAELFLRQTLECVILLALHPNTGISVIVQVINDDGAILPCAINAACAALVDAGVPLRQLVSAVACAVSRTGEIYLDPTKMEEQAMQTHVCAVYPNDSSCIPQLRNEFVEQGLVASITHGAMSIEEYFSCLERCRAACTKIAEFSRANLKQSQHTKDI